MTNRDTQENRAGFWSAVTALTGVFVQTLFFYELSITASVITGMLLSLYYAFQLGKDSIFSGVAWLLLISVVSAVMHVITYFLFVNQLLEV
tara:strand:+ start:7341 stop:7613 length:273 start_codon:yes stop_codon:yes gene_type:complete